MGGPYFNATVSGTGNPGVQGISHNGTGVVGRSGSAIPTTLHAGVAGASAAGPGVAGTSAAGPGVEGRSTSGSGVLGVSGSGDGAGAVGIGTTGMRGEGFKVGVRGQVSSNSGYSGIPIAVVGQVLGSEGGHGVVGQSAVGIGVRGACTHGTGVEAYSQNGIGVRGHSFRGKGVYGKCDNPDPTIEAVGGYFDGGITVVNGGKDFTIDHPLDPQNKYFVHTCIESSERKNVYDGVVRLDKDGATWVELPEWFEALNGDFRYQLTAIGGAAPNMHVAEEISESRFKIAGGDEGMKVCWQVTGSRKDPWAAANPFTVERDKREEERGRYLDPSVYGAPEEQRIMVEPIAEDVEEDFSAAGFSHDLSLAHPG
jgi:hypothetical protein